ncbi:uncharacterized protein LOC111366904 [Olea europaea var. sylvestris]|uniref:uncharacterized protein LOC111366904 n=1 Tax=Olea europaea var. sylvestris TaxID=158386 RepID=UPI000C1CE000|nr:uncharacterized protein LOC111366904 [Olea europaea var. sylvestris]
MVILEGTVELPITLGTHPTTVVIVASFLVVKTPMAYNAIYSRLLLNVAGAIPSTYHQEVSIGAELDTDEKWKLVRCLIDNLDVFAWSPSDVTGVSPTLAQYRLGVLLGAKPIKQKKRNLDPERQEIARAKVEKRLQAGFIREACPKNSYPLPWIDHFVDAISGHERLSFLDAFSGYHQISMAECNQEKTSFITDFGTNSYTVIPFGLKNAGATYQRMVNRVFQELIGNVIEAYVDNRVVKSIKAIDHVACPQRVFDTVYAARWRALTGQKLARALNR